MFHKHECMVDPSGSSRLCNLWAGLLALVIAIGSPAGLQSAVAADREPLAFEGLWEGVDRADGSNLQLSIVGKEDGAYEVLLQDTFFSLCIMDGFTTGRGVNVGEGRIDGDVLVFEFVLNCFADDDPTTPSQTNAGSVEFSLRSGGEILAIGFDPEIFMHRISE